MSDYLPSRETDYVVWLDTFARVAAANADVLGFSPEQIALLAANHADVSSNIAAVDETRKLLRGLVSRKNETIAATQDVTRAFVALVQSNRAVSTNLKDELGVNPRTTPRSTAPPSPPHDLTATPSLGGTTLLRWKRGENASDRTRFIIEASVGDDAHYAYIGSTSRTKFKHTGQAFGVLVWYRVRAERSTKASGWSKPAAAFGGIEGSSRPQHAAA